MPNNREKPGEDVGIDITCYTDPLCCWTWAMLPHWQKMQQEFQGSISRITYKMGGLLPSWRHFRDQVNSIERPAQMGPEWMHARTISGSPINERLWITDPPSSSFPACIAVKCAQLQSSQLGVKYLNLLQEAVMVKNQNISKSKVLLELASSLSKSDHAFNLFIFKADLFGEAGKEAFRKDLQECKYLNVTRLPTIQFKTSNQLSMVLSGYQTFESLSGAIANLQGAPQRSG